MAKRVLRLEIECEDGSRGAAPPVVVDLRGGGAGGDERAVRVSVREGGFEVAEPGRSAHAVAAGEWCQAGGLRVRVAPPSAVRDAIESNPNFTGFELRGRAMEDGKARSIQCAVPAVEGSGFVIGRRAEECDLAVRDRHVSARHLRLFVRDGRMMIEDLRSRWGTSVQGVKLAEPRALHDGDVVTFGNSSFQFINHVERIMKAAAASSAPGAPGAGEEAGATVSRGAGDGAAGGAAGGPAPGAERTAVLPPVSRVRMPPAVARRLERSWPVALTAVVVAVLAWVGALVAGEAVWAWIRGVGERVASWF